MRNGILLILALGINLGDLAAQAPASYSDLGRPYTQYFSPADMQAFPVNSDIIQNKSGLIYVANSRGVLTFNGAEWSTMELKNRTFAISLSLDEKDRLYIGGRGEIGYMGFDSLGVPKYRSLVQMLPESEQAFVSVFYTIAREEGVYFSLGASVVRWVPPSRTSDPDSLGHIDLIAQGGKFILFQIGEQLFMWDQEKKGDLIKLVFAGDNIAQEVVIPKEDMSQLVSHTAKQGAGGNPFYEVFSKSGNELYVFDGTSLNPFQISPQLSTYLRENGVNQFKQLSNGQWLISCNKAASILVDASGNMITRISEDLGLENEIVVSSYEDHQGGIWLGLTKGLAHVELNSPLTVFPSDLFQGAFLNDVIRFQGSIYIATTLAVYVLSADPSSGHETSLSVVEGIEGAQDFEIIDGKLYLTTPGSTESGQLYQINQKKGIYIQDIEPLTNVIQGSRFEDDLIYTGGDFGFRTYRQGKGTWTLDTYLPEIEGIVKNIEEDSKGIVFVGTYQKGAYRIIFPDNPADSIQVLHLNQERGLNEAYGMVHRVDDQIIIASTEGLKRFDSISQQVVPFTEFGPVMTHKGTYTYALAKTNDDWIWAMSYPEIPTKLAPRAEFVALIPQADGNYHYQHTDLRRIPSSFTAGTEFIYADPDYPDLLWIGGREGLFRYDRSQADTTIYSYPAFVSRMTDVNKKSISHGAQSPLHEKRPISILPYKNNSVRFYFGASTYEDISQISYSVFLEGFDDRWTDWDDDIKKDYTNLSEGSYIFKVKARNIYFKDSEIGTFEFAVEPPWYRSVWAYLSYSFLALLIIVVSAWMYSRWKNRKLQADNRRLEGIVQEKTQEILDAQDQLIMQEKMASLGQMTAGIAHELKNPLNFVNNFAESTSEIADELEEELAKYEDKITEDDFQLIQELIEDMRDNGSTILQNGQRADQIITNMMNHSTVQQGERSDLIIDDLLRSHINLASFAFQAKRDGFTAKIVTSFAEPPIHIQGIAQDLGRVIINLIDNALYALEEKSKHMENFSPLIKVASQIHEKHAIITIWDNGLGIPETTQDQVFNPFFTTKPTGDGNIGLGLSISYDIITQGHNGSISVKSEANNFTEFTIRLPMGNQEE